MSQSERKPAAVDVLLTKLDRAFSILICASNTYADRENGFVLPDEHLHTVIWAVIEDLREAKEAFDALMDEREMLQQALKARAA